MKKRIIVGLLIVASAGLTASVALAACGGGGQSSCAKTDGTCCLPGDSCDQDLDTIDNGGTCANKVNACCSSYSYSG
jgi:hypothetical protein